MNMRASSGGAPAPERPARRRWLVLALLLALALVAATATAMPSLLDRGRDEWRRYLVVRETKKLIAWGMAGKVDEIVSHMEGDTAFDKKARARAKEEARRFSERVRETRVDIGRRPGDILVRGVVYDRTLGTPSADNWRAWVLIQVDVSEYWRGTLESVLFEKKQDRPLAASRLFDLDTEISSAKTEQGAP